MSENENINQLDNDETPTTETTEQNENNKKITKNTVINILCILILILTSYILGNSIISNNNKEIELDISTFDYFPSTETKSESELLVNINSNNKFELMQLPGIGASIAESIIDYRKENGDFHEIEEIMNVRGIGNSIFAQIKDYIYIGQTEN